MIGTTQPVEITLPDEMDYMEFDVRRVEEPEEVFAVTSNVAKWSLASARMGVPTGVYLHLTDDLSAEVIATPVPGHGWCTGVSLLLRPEEGEEDAKHLAARCTIGPLLGRQLGIGLVEALVTAEVIGLLELPEDYPDTEPLYRAGAVEAEATDMVARLCRGEGEMIEVRPDALQPRPLRIVKPSWPTGNVTVVVMRDDAAHKDGEFHVGVRASCPNCGDVNTLTIPWRDEVFDEDIMTATLFAMLQLDNYRLLKAPEGHEREDDEDYDDDNNE